MEANRKSSLFHCELEPHAAVTIDLDVQLLQIPFGNCKEIYIAVMDLNIRLYTPIFSFQSFSNGTELAKTP